MADLDITTGDLRIENGDLALDRGLRSVVLVSLFSDARLPDDQELPTGECSRRGWWAENSGSRFGSLLWTVYRGKSIAENAERAREYAIASLEWLREDGIAERVDASASFEGGVLCLEITITRGSAQLWPDLWETEIEERAAFLDAQVLIRTLNS